MSDQDLTKQDEDLPAPEYQGEERRDGHSFGSWPEVLGLVFTIFVCWLIFNFRG
ncbi:hypothetical protein [Tritonibacter horizontis]|uniref:Uncharacterized protein n=1 Tax=Tritonibacter horizontis TaxID=1768241 RepID=A0A132BYC3_9RHOB|nr:hypothetical protein [Tritonibacter horizontis]KUP93391.1 hypothetical protein TRIHO_17320 [Tritonibacter horizontis]